MSSVQMILQASKRRICGAAISGSDRLRRKRIFQGRQVRLAREERSVRYDGPQRLQMVRKYDVSIEDGMDENDWEAGRADRKIGDKVQLVGDEIF